MRATLRPHQAEALAALKASFLAGRRRPMIQAPTGAGKTILAAAVVEGAIRKGNRVVFCVPSISLIDQTAQRFWDEGIRDVGVIQADHPLTRYEAPVQVASAQTLERRTLPDADVVVIDEAHVLRKIYVRWMAGPAMEKVPFIGLSATPWARGLGRYFDDLIVAATTQELIDAGLLSGFRVWAPSHPDLSGVRTVAGDFHEGDLGDAMDKAPLVADVVETWLRRGEGRPTLCFAVNRAHARHLRDRFEAAGIRTGYIDAYSTRDEREGVRKQLESGAIRVVCNVGCLTVGIDWDVRCIVLARPTKSEILFTQIIGRGLRTAPGKQDCIVLDHSDTHARLGFVTSIHHDALDDGTPRKASGSDRKKAEPLPKECPSCAFLKPAKIHKCPSCGFAPERQSDVETEDGELHELNGTGTSKADRATKQRWWSGLLGHGRSRGYRDGWAANQYRSKFGVWPRGLDDIPSEPDAEVGAWIKSRQIAYAKAREKAKGPVHAAA